RPLRSATSRAPASARTANVAAAAGRKGRGILRLHSGRQHPARGGSSPLSMAWGRLSQRGRPPPPIRVDSPPAVEQVRATLAGEAVPGPAPKAQPPRKRSGKRSATG